MNKRVQIAKLEEMLKIEYQNAEGFYAPDDSTIESVYTFKASNPGFRIAALVLRAETKSMHEPQNGAVALTTRMLPLAEAKAAIQTTHSEAFNTRMNFLTEDRSLELTNVLLNSAEKPDGKVVEISASGKPIGLLMYRPLEYMGEMVTLVSWIWRANGLDQKTQAAFRHLVFSILQQQPQAHTVATVHFANRRSMKYFEQLGFKPLCIVKEY